MELIYLASLIVAIVGVTIAVLTLRKQAEVSRLTFFAEYTKRYQEIILHLPENLDDITILDDKKTKPYLRAYFDLCSEQYFLHRKKYLDNEVWKEWKGGMKIMFDKKAVSAYWEKSKTFYSDFNDFVEKAIR